MNGGAAAVAVAPTAAVTDGAQSHPLSSSIALFFTISSSVTKSAAATVVGKRMGREGGGRHSGSKEGIVLNDRGKTYIPNKSYIWN